LADDAVSAEIDAAGGDWETRMEAVIDAGLHRWELAEEELYRQRIAWQEENKRTRAEAEAIWKANHEKLKNAREAWLEEVKTQIDAGRQLWDEKFSEFAESRAQAENELLLYMDAERARRDATLSQLGDMIQGGGSALGEAKEAYYYYNDLLSTLPAPPFGCGAPQNRDQQLYCFYLEQRDIMGASMGRFQTILISAEGTLYDNMQGTGNATGMLRDVRMYAGSLPQDIEAIATADFKSDLQAHMSVQSDDYLLYRRDIYDIVDRNELFVERAAELSGLSAFDYNAAATLDDLEELIADLETEKFGDQRFELLRIFHEDRGTVSDADKLTAIQADIDAWMSDSQDENLRLKKEVLRYFDEGLSGYYLSANENDPYLMTRSEYEWELLRRERNYLAQRLERAEAVKRYADLAAKHDAGLEMASITEERADISRIRADIRELYYLLIKGDVDLDPAVTTDTAVRDSEYNRLLNENEIDPAYLSERETILGEEIALLNAIESAASFNLAALDGWIQSLDTFLNDRVSAEERETHRMNAVRLKLLDYRADLEAGTDAAILTDSRESLQTGMGVLRTELEALRTEYDFNGFQTELDSLRVAVGERALPAYQADLYAIRADLEDNAQQLTDAKIELEEAKKLYREARIDFDILRSGHAEDLIRLELKNNTKALAGILNRMSELEDDIDVAALQGQPLDALTLARVEHLYEISAEQRARDDLEYSDEALRSVQGLEGAKDRLAALDDLLASTNLNALGVTERADAILSQQTMLVDSVSADEAFRSFPEAVNALASITALRAQYADQETQLNEAIGRADLVIADLQSTMTPGSELDAAISAAIAEESIATLRAQLSAVRLALDRNIEKLIQAIRGEEQVRRTLLGQYLELSSVDPEILKNTLEDDTDDYRDRLFTLAEAAADRLVDVLQTRRESDFETLLEYLNTQVHDADHSLRTGLDGYGLNSAGNTEAEEWAIVRDWVRNNRALIEYASKAPEADDADRRSIADKWDELIEAAQNVQDDADFYQEFQDAIPDASDHAWVTQYATDRTALVSRVDAVLTESDANLESAYINLTADDRDLLLSYATIPTDNAADLRDALRRVRDRLNIELYRLSFDYEAIYLRERGIEMSLKAEGLETEYNELAEQFQNDESERAQLERDVAELDELMAIETAGANDPVVLATYTARKTDLQNRLGVLNTRMATLEPQIDALEAEYRQTINVLKEIQNPGSTSGFVSAAATQLEADGLGMGLLQQSINGLRNLVERQEQEERRAAQLREDSQAQNLSSADQIKALIGFYETDVNGNVAYDGDGNALISTEFTLMGVTDPTVTLTDVIGGARSGVELQRWADRLTAVLDDDERVREYQPEVVAAMEQVRAALEAVIIAKRFIEERDTAAADLAAQAKVEQEAATILNKKLLLYAQLENALQNALAQAESSGISPADMILAELEKPEHAYIFQLFQGYDENGASDGYADADMQARADELLRLAARLRQNRVESTVTALSAAFAGRLDDYLTDYAYNSDFAGTAPTAEQYFQSQPVIQAQPVRDALAGIDDADLRAELWTYIENADAEHRLYVSALIGVLHGSTNTGAALRAELSAAIDALENELEAGLQALAADSTRIMLRQRDFIVEESVAAFMAQYATRATDARAAYIPEIDAIADGESLSTAQITLRERADTLLEHAAFTEMRLRIKAIIADSTDTIALKQALRDYLNGINDPAAGDVAQYADELYPETLREALYIAANSDSYNEEHYPQELREFVLIDQYAQARERLEYYQTKRNADTETERNQAVLDFSGVMGSMARYFLILDYESYAASENDKQNYIQAGEGRRSISDYINAYAVSRGHVNGASSLAESWAIAERSAEREYLRIADATTTAGGIHRLDEREYFADYQAYILLGVVDHYVGAQSVTLNGATIAERRANFRADFENLLDDTAYAVNGQTVRRRLLASDVIDAVFDLAFSHLEEGTDRMDYLPAYLDERRLDGTLNDPITDAIAELPPELTAIAGYATMSATDVLAAVDGRYARAYARMRAQGELDAQVQEERLDPALLADGVQIDKVIAAAGYETAGAALKTELRELLKKRLAVM
ncbi:MAG: hypothetical protein KDK27_04865, partial [Leptospiraceae bacterium]|nr:hypothetical protein [Leptospiraceae bacterium]